MISKKGYTMGIYMTWLFVGLLIGAGLVFYAATKGYLCSFISCAPAVVP